MRKTVRRLAPVVGLAWVLSLVIVAFGVEPEGTPVLMLMFTGLSVASVTLVLMWVVPPVWSAWRAGYREGWIDGRGGNL